MPGLVVNLVTETGGINDSQRDAGSLLVQLKLCITEMVSIRRISWRGGASFDLIWFNLPTVTGLMRTPSSS